MRKYELLTSRLSLIAYMNTCIGLHYIDMPTDRETDIHDQNHIPHRFVGGQNMLFCKSELSRPSSEHSIVKDVGLVTVTMLDLGSLSNRPSITMAIRPSRMERMAYRLNC